MKVKATIVFNMKATEIVGIVYEDRVLRGCSGAGRMKSSILSRVLETPINDFRLEEYYKSWPGRLFMVTEMELDVFPRVFKIKNPVVEREVPYKCELYPSPSKRESEITFERYSELMNDCYNRAMSSRSSL